MIKREIFIFSSNINKTKEIKKILSQKKFKIYTLKDFSIIKMPKENSKSIKENAIKKSKFGYKFSNIPCIADDSGIFISALKNKPGAESNRYQKKNGGYNKTFQKIIEKTKKSNNNNANFQTIISFTYNKNKTVSFRGLINGAIVEKPIGRNGFGYDPIFKPSSYNKTYAQMTKKQKNKVSHRGQALKKFLYFINKLI